MRKLIVCCQGKFNNIHCVSLNDVTGELFHRWSSDAGDNPTFAVKWEDKLLTVNEIVDCSALSLWNINEDGLSHIGSGIGPGSGSCHVALWPDGKYATVSNYGSGSFTTFALDKRKGVFFESTISPKAERSRDNLAREPHAHSLVFTGKLVLGADLGRDVIYLFKGEKGKLRYIGAQETTRGSGPRHMCVSKSTGIIYLTTENSNEVLSFSQVKENLALKQTTPVHNGLNGCSSAEISLTEDEKWLLCSVRGVNHISVMEVLHDGTLAQPVYFPVSVNGPRHFILLRGVNFLVCAGQYSNSIVSYRIENGKLLGPISTLKYERPVCLVEC